MSQCHNVTMRCFLSFPDAVDSRFPEQVDTFLKSLIPFLKGLTFFWKG